MLDIYDVVAQKLSAQNPGMHKWIGLHVISHYPTSANNFWFIKEAAGYRFCLLIFELDDHALKYFDETGSDEVQNSLLYKFNTQEELYQLCEDQDINPEKFAPPWYSKYPFE